VELSLRSSNGVEVFRSAALKSSGDTTRFLQLPLYLDGNKLLATGMYALTAKISRGQSDIGVAMLPIEIR
jgi:hypothetical protein